MTLAAVHPSPLPPSADRYLASPTSSAPASPSYVFRPSPSVAWGPNAADVVPSSRRTLRASSRSPLSPTASFSSLRPSSVSPTPPSTSTIAGRLTSTLSPNAVTLPKTLPGSSASTHSSVSTISRSSSSIATSATSGKNGLVNIPEGILDLVFGYIRTPAIGLASRTLYKKTGNVLAKFIYRNYIQPNDRLREAVPLMHGQPNIFYMRTRLPEYYQKILSNYLQTKAPLLKCEDYTADQLIGTVPPDVLPINFNELPLNFNALPLLDTYWSSETITGRTALLHAYQKDTFDQLRDFHNLSATNIMAFQAQANIQLRNDPQFFSRQLRYLFDQIHLATRKRNDYPKDLYDLTFPFCTTDRYDPYLSYADWHYVFLIHLQVILTRSLGLASIKHSSRQQLLVNMINKMKLKEPQDPQNKDFRSLFKHLKLLLSPKHQADLRAKMQNDHTDTKTIAAQFEINLQTTRNILERCLPGLALYTSSGAATLAGNFSDTTEAIGTSSANAVDSSAGAESGCCIIS